MADLTSALARFLNSMVSGTPTVEVGTAASSIGVGGMLAATVTAVGNDADTAEKDLWSTTLEGGTVTVDGSVIRIIARFRTGATNNNKRFKIYFGGTAVYDTGVITTNAGTIAPHGVIQRITGTTQIATFQFSAGVVASTPGETLSGDVTIRMTGASPTTGAANDIILDHASVEVRSVPF